MSTLQSLHIAAIIMDVSQALAKSLQIDSEANVVVHRQAVSRSQ
jgi:hypothetical protein